MTRRATARNLVDLVPDPENRRKHNPRNLAMVAESLQQVGAARSIVIDENDVILAGNGVAAAAAAAADILIHRQIIWVKPHMVLTRSGQYHWKHELCFYGWIRGTPCHWYGNKSQVSVWEIGESQRGRQHPTQKPVALFLPPIHNHTQPGDAVYEPFSGSGSQFIAAEQTDRRCIGIELEPRYVQVAIDRWEAFTGKKAVKVGDARS